MELNMFAFGQATQYWEKKYSLTQPSVSMPTTNLPGSFSTSQLLNPQPFIMALDHQMGAVGVEDYRENTDLYREQSILRAAASSLKIGKNEDGTIWVENATDPQSMLAKRRASGGEKQILWHSVELNLYSHSMEGTYALDSVGLNIDYFASEYAQYKTRIEQQYTGEEQKAELVKLENTFASRVGETAAHFAETVGGYLEKNGVSGEQDAIRNSFLDIYEQRKTDYLNFIAENPDYARVKGTEDEWLLTTGDFMGEQLRYAYISQQPAMNLTSQYGYSVDDLNAAGTLVKELTSIESNLSRSIYGCSEEELGVELGLAAMRYVVISGHFGISSNVKSKLDKSLSNFVERQLEKTSAYIDQQRRDPYVRYKEAYAVDFDQQVVLAIIKRMVKDLSSAEDINTAFKSDFNTNVALYKKKSSDIQMGMLSRYNSYYSSWVNKNYATDWNNFVRQLSASNRDEARRYLLNDQMQWVDIAI